LKGDRKQIILQSLAGLLEERNLSKVTTAVLAEKSGITEAALYRHFLVKDRYFLNFLDFVMMLFFLNVLRLKNQI